MNIIDEIHAQFNAHKLRSEYYVKYIFLGFIILTALISNEEQKPIFTIMAIVLYGLNKVIIADLSTSQITSVWRLFRVPIMPRSMIAKDVKRISLSHYENTRSDDSVELRYRVSCYGADNDSNEYIYSSRHYKHAKALSDWLVKRLQMPFEDQVFNPGKLTKAHAIDANLANPDPVTENNTTTITFKNDKLTDEISNIKSIRLPRQALPFYYVIFIIILIGVAGAILLPMDDTPLVKWTLIVMFIISMKHYVISLFPVDVVVNDNAILVKKAYKRKKIHFDDLMDIAIKPEQLILVIREDYYVLPYKISEEKAKRIRSMIMHHLGVHRLEGQT